VSGHGVPTFIVDGSLDLEATVASVEELFGEALAEGPRAETIGSQVRSSCARSWAQGDVESVVREFVCECGDTACEARVHVPVAAVLSGAVLARRHR
jgi:hypothetical protein